MSHGLRKPGCTSRMPHRAYKCLMHDWPSPLASLRGGRVTALLGNQSHLRRAGLKLFRNRENHSDEQENLGCPLNSIISIKGKVQPCQWRYLWHSNLIQ